MRRLFLVILHWGLLRFVAAIALTSFAALATTIQPAHAGKLDVAAANVVAKQAQLNYTAGAVWTMRGLIQLLDDDQKFQFCGVALDSTRGRRPGPNDLAALTGCYAVYRARVHGIDHLSAELHHLAPLIDRAIIPNPAALDPVVAAAEAPLAHAAKAIHDTGASRSIRHSTCRPSSDNPTLVGSLRTQETTALDHHDLIGARQAFDLARAELSVSLSEELLCGATPALADAEMDALDYMADQLSRHSAADEYRYTCLSTGEDASQLMPFCYQFDGGPSASYSLLRWAAILYTERLIGIALPSVDPADAHVSSTGFVGEITRVRWDPPEGIFINVRANPEPDPTPTAKTGWDCPLGGCGGTGLDPGRSQVPVSTSSAGRAPDVPVGNQPFTPDLPAGFGPDSNPALPSIEAFPIDTSLNPNTISADVASAFSFRSLFPDAWVVAMAKAFAPGLWSWTAQPPALTLPAPPRLEDFRPLLHASLQRAYERIEQHGRRVTSDKQAFENSVLINDVDYLAALDFTAGLAPVVDRVQDMLKTAYSDDIAVLQGQTFALMTEADAAAKAANATLPGKGGALDQRDIVSKSLEPSLSPATLYVARTLDDLKDFVSQRPLTHPVFRNAVDRDLWNRIIYIPPAFPQSAMVRELARRLAFNETDYYDAHDAELAGQGRKDALTLLGVLSSFTPVVSNARSMYEAYTGQDLMTGEVLSDAKRGFAVAEAIFGVPHLIPTSVKKLLGLYGAVMNPLTKGQREFASFVIEKLENVTDIHGATTTLIEAGNDLLVDRMSEKPYVVELGHLTPGDATAVGASWVGPNATAYEEAGHRILMSTDRLRIFNIGPTGDWPEKATLWGRVTRDRPFRNEGAIQLQ